MSVNSEFDKGIGGKLRDVSTPPPADLWDDIEARLPEERRRRPFAIWWLSGVAALGMVVLLVGGLLLSPETRKEYAVEQMNDRSEAALIPADGDASSSKAAVVPAAGSKTENAAVPLALPEAAFPERKARQGTTAAQTFVRLLPAQPTRLEQRALQSVSSSGVAIALAPNVLLLAAEARRPYPTPAALPPTSLSPLSTDRPDLDLVLPPLASLRSSTWRWSARLGVAYLLTVPNETAFERGKVAELANDLAFANYANTSAEFLSTKPLVSDRSSLPLGYAAQLAISSRQGIRFHVEAASGQTQISSATVGVDNISQGATRSVATTQLSLASENVHRLVFGLGASYAPRLGRWTPSLALGGAWVPARKFSAGREEAMLANADTTPDPLNSLVLRQRVLAKATLGIEYALNPRLDLGVDYSLSRLGSAAGVGLRYSW